MELLITLKSIRLNGEIVPPGQTVKVVDGQSLVDRGYARRLTKAEARAIVNTYAEYAREVFSNPMPDLDGADTHD
jgi:hypothetical protein